MSRQVSDVVGSCAAVGFGIFALYLALCWLFGAPGEVMTWHCERSTEVARSYERETVIEGNRYVCAREYE